MHSNFASRVMFLVGVRKQMLRLESWSHHDWIAESKTCDLYAFAEATSNFVISFAFVTNEMAQKGEDFEKGDSGGAIDALELIEETVGVLNDFLLSRGRLKSQEAF